jgi:hypothetical protein
MIPLGARANADILFKLEDSSDKPVAGRIDMSKPASQGRQEAAQNWVTILPSLPDGKGKYEIARCAPPGILFRAFSYDLTLFLSLPEMTKACVIGEIVFHFTRKAYASALIDALSPQSPLIAASPRAKTLQVAVISALNSGDYPTAATNSMLLEDEIRTRFGAKAADPFRILATDVAASAITNSQALVFDPPQKKYVLGPHTVKAVTNFQDSVGLKTNGALNWATVQKLPDFSLARSQPGQEPM